MAAITAVDVEAARERFDDPDVVQRTPVEYSRSLSDGTGADVHLKLEHLQRTGSFKTRGAYNKLLDVTANGEVSEVVAASAGNHAQGVALAAAKTGVPATIVMPTTAPRTKVDATRGYGAEVVLRGVTFGEAVEHARSLAVREDVEFVHAFDDPAIVAGQGTLGLELVEDVPDVDTVVVPIGGGLIGGIAAALAETRPNVRIVGVQTDDAATVPDSLRRGRPVPADDVDTIADGIATGSTGRSDVLADRGARRRGGHRQRGGDRKRDRPPARAGETAHGGAGSTAVAALLSGKLDVAGETVVPVLTGGNLDMSMLRTILTHELTARRQLIRLRVRIAALGANIRTVHHHRADGVLSVGEAFLVFLVETSGRRHASEIVETIEGEGYDVAQVN